MITKDSTLLELMKAKYYRQENEYSVLYKFLPEIISVDGNVLKIKPAIITDRDLINTDTEYKLEIPKHYTGCLVYDFSDNLKKSLDEVEVTKIDSILIFTMPYPTRYGYDIILYANLSDKLDDITDVIESIERKGYEINKIKSIDFIAPYKYDATEKSARVLNNTSIESYDIARMEYGKQGKLKIGTKVVQSILDGDIFKDPFMQSYLQKL